MGRLFGLAAALVAMVGGYGSASAQSVGVEVYGGPRYQPYYQERYERSAPRVYGYYRDDDTVYEPRVIVRPSNCGQYRYWNGTRCADARFQPPRLD